MPLVLSLLFLAAATAAWQSAPAVTSAVLPSPALPYPSPPAPAPASKPEEFVRVCCARTLYPRLCVAGLAPYAAAVRSSHARLALAAANLTRAALASLADRIPAAGEPGDCAEAMAAAANEAARAAERLGGVERAVGPEVLWRVGDAVTWLSAAMTYEDTCEDGLRPGKSAPPAPVRAELRAGVRRAKQYTSIALALVNMLVR